MKPRHPKYKIKQGDTLQSITQIFGVEQDVWTRYHNNMCRLDHVIRDVLPRHLEEIYLLPELWEKESSLNKIQFLSGINDIEYKKVKFGIDNSIYIRQIPTIRTYRLKIIYPQKNSRIDCEVITKGLKIIPQNVMMSFDKKKIFINGLEPDMVIDEVAVKASEGIYPICLSINYINKTQKVLNLIEIQESWKRTKELIKKEYTGRIIDSYLNRTEDNLTEEKVTCKLIDNDIFFGLFTHSIYGSYTKELKFKTEMRMSLGNINSTLNFKGEQWINPEYNHLGGVFVYFKGYAKGFDMKSGTEAYFELNVEYNLQYETFSIKDIIADINMIKEGEKTPVMQATIYQQRIYETNN
jgi:hypothetical protein